MRQKIENKIHIEVEGAPDLTKANDLVIWVEQNDKTREYTPSVVSETELLVVVPFNDCCSLNCGLSAKIQLAGIDEDGNAFSSDPVNVSVGELLKKEGYCGPT